MRTAPLQALARLHVAAASPVVSGDALGRPRIGDEGCSELVDLGPAPPPTVVAARLASLSDVIVAAAGSNRVPAAVVAALVHAEITAVRPFVHGNGLVARAMERALVQALGLDPTGVAVPEAGHVSNGGPAYLGALTAYAQGGAAGVGLWLSQAGEAMVRGAAEGDADQRRGACGTAQLSPAGARSCRFVRDVQRGGHFLGRARQVGGVATPTVWSRTDSGTTSPRGVDRIHARQKSREDAEYPRESSSLGTVHPRAHNRGDTLRMHAW